MDATEQRDRRRMEVYKAILGPKSGSAPAEVHVARVELARLEALYKRATPLETLEMVLRMSGGKFDLRDGYSSFRRLTPKQALAAIRILRTGGVQVRREEFPAVGTDGMKARTDITSMSDLERASLWMYLTDGQRMMLAHLAPKSPPPGPPKPPEPPKPPKPGVREALDELYAELFGGES